MAAFYQLVLKGHNSPLKLNEVDEAICKHLDVPVHPSKWCFDWHNSIGFLIATGKPLGSDQLRRSVESWSDDTHYVAVLLKILDFLTANYNSYQWQSMGR